MEQIAVDQPRPTKKFIYEMIFGLCAAGSVLLTEVGRKLPANISLHAVEKRLSRQLGSANWDEDALLEQAVSWAARGLKAETVLALDISHLRKAYAAKMACLGQVHDGSTGEIGTGYWLLAVEAQQAAGQRQGLYLQAYSAQAAEFASENRQLRKAVELIERCAPRRALWVIDSAGDRFRLHRAFRELRVRYLVRVKRERSVYWHGQRTKIMAVAAQVLWCGSFRLAHRRKRGRWRRGRGRYGFERITWQEATYSVIVAAGVAQEQFVIWTNEVVTKPEEAAVIVRAYLRRWAVEDANRVIKQEFALERLRVSDWRRVQRLVLLAGIAYSFVCSLSRQGQRVLKQLLALARRIRPPKKVIAYAVRKGIAALWAVGLRKRPSFGFG